MESNRSISELTDKLCNAHAQLALSVAFTSHLQCQLAHKEKRQNSVRQTLFGDGLPCILMHPESLEQVCKKEVSKEWARQEKIAQQCTHEYNAAKTKVETIAWERAKQFHLEAMKIWEEEVVKAKEDWVPKKNWLKKPKCILRKEVVEGVSKADIIQYFVEDDTEYIEVDLDNTEGTEDKQEEE